MDSKAPQVFISYAHESTAFRQTVKELAEYLRVQGIRVITDHPYENRAPQEGWRTWMLHQVEDADLVLVVCSPKYKVSFEKRDAELPEGFGRTWEAAVITHELYFSKLQNAKYIPILPDGGSFGDVPTHLSEFSNGLRFPSQNERIFRAITEEVQDPNAAIPLSIGQRLGAVSPSKAPQAESVAVIHSDAKLRDWKKWGLILGGILAALGAGAEFTGYSLRDIFHAKPNSPAPAAPLDTLTKPTVQQTTHGKNSPIQNTGGGDAYYNAPDSDWEKAAKHSKSQSDTTRKR